MPLPLDPLTAAAVFTLPRSGGAFDPEFFAYLRDLGRRRASVLLCFPPKAAGTFLRAAVIDAAGGQLMRIVHAFGGREASPYLPIFLRYFSEPGTVPIMVSHVHMQAFPANRHFFDALDLKPVIMLRSVPDMLCSFIDMLNSEPITPELWINSQIPADFPQMTREAQADFIVDVMGPWYASYFATWLDYAREAPERVCVLDYTGFTRDPAGTLATLLRHSRVDVTPEACKIALDRAWTERRMHRFNHGQQGRGAARFGPDQLARIETLLFHRYDLSAYRHVLMPAPHEPARMTG